MEIRFETALLSRSFPDLEESNDDNKECPKECPREHDSSSVIPDMMEDSIGICILQHSSGLHKQAYGNGYYVVCNPTGTGHIAVLDQDAVDLLERFRFPTSLGALHMEEKAHRRASIAIELFSKMGFLESAEQTSVVSKQQPSQVLNAWLHMTNACNLRCDYCYLDKTAESMADDTAKKAIDAIFRSAVKHRFKTVQLRYAGGEPSLQGERIIALHDYALTQAQQHGIEVRAAILSNGVFLADRLIDRLKDRHISIMISLDGIGSYHDHQRPFINGRGSFQFVDRTITRLLTKKLVPHISVTVSQRNLAGLPELITYILERELPFSLNYYRNNDCSMHLEDLQFADEQMIGAMRSVFTLIEHNLPQRSLLSSLIDKASLQHPHSRTCGVGHNYLVIDQKGGIAKCHADIKRTVATVATDDPLFMIRNDPQGVQGYSVDEKEGCRSCSWRYWCSGGCPLLTYRTTGRSDVKSPNCNIYKALFPDVLRLEALRLLKYVPPYQLLRTQPDEDAQRLLYI